MTNMVNAYAIRELYEKLPFCAFEHICEELPWLLEMEEWRCEYVHFHYLDEGYTLDDVADEYGYENFEDFQCSDVYSVVFSVGVLVVE